MSWKSTEDKERFFEALDRAFNTPASETLVVPQIHGDAPKPFGNLPDLERQELNFKQRPTKRRRTSSKETLKSSTGVGTRSAGIEIIKNTSLVQKRSPETSRRSSTNGNENPKKLSLLDGMVLYFIPNSKKNGIRRFRMALFAQHGAEVRHVWSNDITHIICDTSATGERVLRDLHWEQFLVINL